MDIQVRNSPELKRFIRNHQAGASTAIAEWEDFASRNPDVRSFKSSEEWYIWAAAHPGTDTSLWVGREIQAVSLDKQETQNAPESENKPNSEHHVGASFGRAIGGLTEYFNKPQILEHDWDYIKVEYDLQHQWLKDHKAQDFFSKEGLDFLYKELAKKTEEKLTEQASKNPKLAKRLAQYEEKRKSPQKDMNQDQEVWMVQSRISRETNSRYSLLLKEHPEFEKLSQKELKEKETELHGQIHENAWEEFVLKHPEKAQAYSQDAHRKNNEPLKEAMKRIEQKRIAEAEKKQLEERVKKEQEEKIKKEQLKKPREGAHLIEDMMSAYEERYPQKGLADIREQEDEDQGPQISRQDIQRLMESESQPPSEPPSEPTQTQPNAPRQPSSSPKIPRTSTGLPRGVPGMGGATGAGRQAMLGAGRAILLNPYVLAFLGILLLIIIIVVIIVAVFGQGDPDAISPRPNTYKPLDIVKSVNKTEFSVGEEIEYTIKIGSNTLGGNVVRITENIPEGTVFVGADNNGILVPGTNTVQWEFSATKKTPTDRIYPDISDTNATIGKPIQTQIATAEMIKTELERQEHSKRFVQHASFIIEKGKQYNVEPSFFMAAWKGESNYYEPGGGIPNNPAGIMSFPDIDEVYGARPHSQCIRLEQWGVCFANFPTFEAGIEAFFHLIKREYYPRGQTDTWKIHSGIGPNHQFAYHGVNHIGPQFPVKTWKEYVDFFYRWNDTMNRITSGNDYGINEIVKLRVRITEDNRWISNTGLGFAPGTGNTTSNQVVVRVGNPPEDTRPGAPRTVPVPPAGKLELRDQIHAHFSIRFSDDLARNNSELLLAGWEALHIAQQKAPNFIKLIKEVSDTNFNGAPIIVSIHQDTTETNNATGAILLSPGTVAAGKSDLFKHIFIHELGHIIHGPAGSPRKDFYDADLRAAQGTPPSGEGVLTEYSISLDESFAELVSYYVLEDIVEQPIRKDRRVKWPNINPLKTGKYPRHLELAEKIFR